VSDLLFDVNEGSFCYVIEENVRIFIEYNIIKNLVKSVNKKSYKSLLQFLSLTKNIFTVGQKDYEKIIAVGIRFLTRNINNDSNIRNEI
jgi:hypothetical protein